MQKFEQILKIDMDLSKNNYAISAGHLIAQYLRDTYTNWIYEFPNENTPQFQNAFNNLILRAQSAGVRKVKLYYDKNSEIYLNIAREY